MSTVSERLHVLCPGDFAVQEDDFRDLWQHSPDAVLIQHGFVRSGRMLRGWVPHFARSYRVIRPDLPGCGEAPDPGTEYQFSTDDMVERTLRILDERGIERVHYVGEGIGGVIGAELAGRYPDRVRSLTTMTTPLAIGPQILASHALGYPSWGDAIGALGTRGWWVAARRQANDLASDPAVDTAIADEVGRTPVHVAIALSRWGVKWKAEELFPKVKQPVLFIWPEDGKFNSARDRDEMTKLPSRGRQFIVPGVKTQMYPYVYADLVASEVARFVREIDQAE